MNDKNKILYVDDEEINTQLFEINFSDIFNVLTATSGMEGIEILNNNLDVEFVISDMKMPEMNGLQFISKVKKIKNDVPCIILSGYCQTSEIIEALNNRTIVDYMIKPFNIPKINELISKYIKSADL